MNKALLEQVPRRPSEYMASNVYFGASFASPYEVEQAVMHGLSSQLLWGSDYPHLEGTFVFADGREAPSVTRLGVAEHVLRGFRRRDRADDRGQCHRGVQPRCVCTALRSRDEIDAPTLDELATPIDSVPEAGSVTAFRSGAGGWS